MNNQSADSPAAIWFKIEPYRVKGVAFDEFLKKLILIEAPPALIEWVMLNEYSFYDAWLNCPASDWMLYLISEFASELGITKDSEHLMLMMRLKRRAADEFKRVEAALTVGSRMDCIIDYLLDYRATIRQILTFVPIKE